VHHIGHIALRESHGLGSTPAAPQGTTVHKFDAIRSRTTFLVSITSHYLFASITSRHHTTPCDPIAAHHLARPFPSRPASQPRARYDVSSCRVSCAHRVSRAVYCMRLHVPVQDARAEERRPYVHRSTVGAVSPRAPRRLCKPTKRMITCSVTPCVARVSTVCDCASQYTTP
jgi:hypothetical protein